MAAAEVQDGQPLRGQLGRSPGAPGHPVLGSTVTAEGLVWLSLAGEQGCGAQAGDARWPKPLLVLIDLILVLFVEGAGVGRVAHSRVYRNLLPQPHHTGPTRGAHTPCLASGPGRELRTAGS